ALITVEEASGQNRIAYIPGATTTVTADAARNACERVRPQVVLATLELPESARVALFAAAREHGATVVVNATPEAVGARTHLPVIDVLIVNETEASDLLGYEVGPENAAEAAAGLAAMGPSAIAITLGAAGAVVLTPDGVSSLPAPKVTVVDTTGAGDAFCGAVAARLAAGQSVAEAAQAGVIAGSLATTKAGAQPSMPTAAEIARLLN
ncbi:MAG: PfkB family carbohydrate kinase, partial [Chloroflexota bacterium]